MEIVETYRGIDIYRVLLTKSRCVEWGYGRRLVGDYRYQVKDIRFTSTDYAKQFIDKLIVETPLRNVYLGIRLKPSPYLCYSNNKPYGLGTYYKSLSNFTFEDRHCSRLYSYQLQVL